MRRTIQASPTRTPRKSDKKYHNGVGAKRARWGTMVPIGTIRTAFAAKGNAGRRWFVPLYC
jgi:hypothetical protein